MAIIKKLKKERGALIIEILIVAAIIVIALVSLLNAVAFSLKMSALTKQNDQAQKLAEETLEVVRSFRDGTDWGIDGLGTLTLNISYHPEKTIGNPPKWNLVSGEEDIPGAIYKRKVVFSRISRDPTSKNIESVYNPDPAHADPNTRKITATVSWQGKTVEVSTLLTNWR